MIGPVQAKLMFVGNITTGGFKIQEGQATLFKIEWMQTMQFNFNDEQMIVRLNEKKQRTITFDNAEFYNQFKEIHSEVAPKENPFLGFKSSFVPRATVVQNPKTVKN